MSVQNNTIDIQNRRNYGIDLLRLFAMLFVTVLHIFGQGGVLKNTTGLSYNTSFLFEIIAYCAVNCYAAISGYVMYHDEEKTFKYSKYITTWIPVFFYSFGIGLISFIVSGAEAVTLKELIKFALPVTSNQYWYFSCYTGLFFIVPFINKFIRRLSKKETTVFIFTLFFIFVCFGLLTDPFKFNAGYSFVWLTIMYLFGAFFKKCDIIQKIKTSHAAFGLIICTLVTWGFKILSPIYNDLFISYTSPTIVLSALFWLSIFAKLNIKKFFQTIIKFTAPAAFGVYLIHEQSIIRDNFISNKFIWICDFEWWLIPIVAIGCAIAVFLVCLSIEILRIHLFRVLRIDKVVEKICFKIENKTKNFPIHFSNILHSKRP